MDTPVIPQPRVLRNRFGYKVADLEKPIATGAFGEIWLATLDNPVQLLARRIVLGEDDPGLLGLDIPFNPGKEIFDKILVETIYKTAQQCWTEIHKMGVEKGYEEFKEVVNLIDPVLIDNPHIAVKVVRPLQKKESKGDLEARLIETHKRFKQESHILQRFAYPNNHPNIIRRYSLVNDPEMGECLLQEYINGPTLEEHLNTQEGRRLSPKAALDIIVPLADAVKYIHTKGIVHRDLKPSNIIIREDGTPVIIDFGVSKDEDTKLTMDNLAIGTPRYMAPEQARGEKIDGRTDVYALATILFEMIAGERAYPYPTTAETMEKLKLPTHPSRIVNYARNLHPFLRQFIEAGRAKDSDERLTDEEFYVAAKEVQKTGKFYQEKPLATSSTLLRVERDRAVRRTKMERADCRVLEEELQNCALGERIVTIKEYVAKEEFTEAREEIAKLQIDLNKLPERDEDLQSQLDKYAAELQTAVTHREVRNYLGAVAGALEQKDYVAFGTALDAAEKKAGELPAEPKYEPVRVNIKGHRDNFDNNYKRHVGKFNLAKELLDAAQTAYAAFEEQYAAKKPVATEDIGSLLKKIEGAEADLREHKNPELVGPAHGIALVAADELRKKANRLHSFAGAMNVLNSVKEKYDRLSELYAKQALVDVKPMDDLLTQLDSLAKDMPIYDPSRQGMLYLTASTYAGEMREVIADLRKRVVPKA